MRKPLLVILILILPTTIAIFVYFLIKPRYAPTIRDATGQVSTLAGTGAPGTEDGPARQASFADPFGIAVDHRGDVFVAEGGASNRIRRVTREGAVETLAGGDEGYADGSAAASRFNTPSGMAIDRRGDIIIADTSNNRIRKLLTGGQVTTVAGSGERGLRDGPADQAQFDAPLGVAVDRQGNIFVADTYNDCIRKVSADGDVTTIAGAGAPGYGDGEARAALFDTPSGIAADADGNVFVADTGNHAVRKITPQGEVITITGGPQQADEQAGQVRLSRPVGIVVTHDGFLFVADEGAGRIIRIAPDGEAVSFAGVASGYADGPASQARFSGPAGIAVDREGNLYVADAQNLLIRRIAQVSSNSVEDQPDKGPEKFIQPADRSEDANTDAVIPRLSAAAVGAGKSFPWPLNPQNQWHEVAGVVGEARGAPGGIALDHLHAGLDVRGNMGEPAVSVLDEKTSSPISAWGFNDSSEGIRVGAISYIHIRVGRDATDRIQSADRFKPRLDQAGKLAGVRVRRGTRFRAGDVLGTLNRLFHVHMNFGPWSAIANPIEFPFVGFKDTVAPVIEPNGIEVVNLAGEPFKQRRDGRLVISGDVDVIVTAYDRVDGNVSSRKLGLYKAGYQLLKEGGATARGFDRPLINIEFNRLPPDDSAVFVVYGAGSGVSAYGTPTKFKYIVTNRVRDGAAQDGFLRTSGLDAGNYLLRVIAEDHSGNRASGKSTELAITIVK